MYKNFKHPLNEGFRVEGCNVINSTWVGSIDVDTENYTEYQNRKVEFLNYKYPDNKGKLSTKKQNWGSYIKNIHTVELSNNKDLMRFSSEEIEDLLNSVATESLKSRLWAFVSSYFDWCMDNKTILDNPFSKLHREELVTVDAELVKSKYCTVEHLDTILNSVIDKIGYQNAMPLVLARYGISGPKNSHMINLKVKDLDAENKNIYIYLESGKLENILPVDDLFIRYFNKTIEPFKSKGSDRYVLARSKNNPLDNFKISNNFRYVKSLLPRDSYLDKVVLTDLVMCRRFDLFDQIRERVDGRIPSETCIAFTRIFQRKTADSYYVGFIKQYVALRDLSLDEFDIQRKIRSDLKIDKTIHTYIKKKDRLPGDTRYWILNTEMPEIYKKRKLYKESLREAKLLDEQAIYNKQLSDKVNNIIANKDPRVKAKIRIAKGSSKLEGGAKDRVVRTYRRSAKNREDAIRIHGTNCMVCGFDFYKVYGELGEGFIEVHHNNPLADQNGDTEVNPMIDLAPVCSNCHSMLHRSRKNVLSIQELKEILSRQKLIRIAKYDIKNF